jgi:hypothetical protein
VERRFVAWVFAAAAFMAAILLLDRDGFGPQLALGGATAVFLALFLRALDLEARPILWCVAVATTGEVVLSLGWGLYAYHHALIPLYVPPGHGLFFALAMATSRQELVRRHALSIMRTIFVAGTLLALWSLGSRHDVWGFLWWIGALLLVRASRNRLMLAACFTYTIVLEYAGTAIGNWRWAAEVPFVGLHSANPPAGVGVLYILLDLIVMGIVALGVDRYDRNQLGSVNRLAGLFGSHELIAAAVDGSDDVNRIHRVQAASTRFDEGALQMFQIERQPDRD